MANKNLTSGYSETTAIEDTDTIAIKKDSGDGLWRFMTGLSLKSNTLAAVESLDHTDLPKTLVKADANKIFIIDLSSASADETITLPAEATAGNGWGVRIRLTGLASTFKLIVNNDAATAEWEMSVPKQTIYPVTDGVIWRNAQSGALLNKTTHTADATHTYAKGAFSAKVWCTAGGGGGGGSDDSADASGSGGGAGGTAIGWITGFSGTETATVGTGGSGGGAAAAGSNGNSSSFGAFLSATGGEGGSVPGTGDGGDGGVGSSGDINLSGGDGAPNQLAAKTSGGMGGASYWGGGGKGGRVVDNGSPGEVYGSGGGGGGEGNTGGDKTGGNGKDGVIYIEEYA